MTPGRTERPATRVSPELVRVVGYAFGRITTNCPAWKNSVIGDELEWSRSYKKELTVAFIKFGVHNTDQINAGVNTLAKKNSPFLPTPNEFAELCAPKTLESHRLRLPEPPISDEERAKGKAAIELIRYQRTINAKFPNTVYDPGLFND